MFVIGACTKTTGLQNTSGFIVITQLVIAAEKNLL